METITTSAHRRLIRHHSENQRRLIRVGAVCAATLALLCGVAATPPAQAAPGGLMISIDGVNYVSNGTLPLFENIGKVVPGDSRTDSIWVKNEAQQAGRLRIDLINPKSDNADLAEELSMTVAPESGAAPGVVTLADGIRNGDCTVLNNEVILQPGQSMRIDLTAAVDSKTAKREGALGTIDFGLRGVLEEAIAVPNAVPPGSSCGAITIQPPTTSDPRLEVTGVASQIATATLGLLAAGGGLLFAILAWRRRAAATASEASPIIDDAPSITERA